MKKLILVGLMLAIGGGLRAQEASTRGFMHRSKFFSGTISDMMPQLKVLSDLQLKETNEAAKKYTGSFFGKNKDLRTKLSTISSHLILPESFNKSDIKTLETLISNIQNTRAKEELVAQATKQVLELIATKEAEKLAQSRSTDTLITGASPVAAVADKLAVSEATDAALTTKKDDDSSKNWLVGGGLATAAAAALMLPELISTKRFKALMDALPALASSARVQSMTRGQKIALARSLAAMVMGVAGTVGLGIGAVKHYRQERAQ